MDKKTHSVRQSYHKQLPKGLTENLVRAVSAKKKEPHWMLDRRLQGLQLFLAKPLPDWGVDLSDLNFEQIYYYIKPETGLHHTWDSVPEAIKDTFIKLGIPEAERHHLAGVESQLTVKPSMARYKKSYSKEVLSF